jgi:hypothetical protein
MEIRPLQACLIGLNLCRVCQGFIKIETDNIDLLKEYYQEKIIIGLIP